MLMPFFEKFCFQTVHQRIRLRAFSKILIPKSASTKTLTHFFEDVASQKRVNENVDALSRRVCSRKVRKVLSRRRNGDIGYENDGKEHEETDETGDDGEDDDEDDEVEDDDAERRRRTRTTKARTSTTRAKKTSKNVAWAFIKAFLVISIGDEYDEEDDDAYDTDGYDDASNNDDDNDDTKRFFR